MLQRPTITIHASARIEAAASDGVRRFKVEPAYAGGALRVRGYDLPIIVDLASMSVASNVVANLDHNAAQRVGHVDQHHNDGQRLDLAGVVSAVSGAAMEFVESALKDFPWSASIEAAPGLVEQIERGQSVTVNGQTFQGPVYVVRAAELTGVGFVSKGADHEARAMLASHKSGTRKMDSQFQSWASQMGVDTKLMTGAQLANLHANYQGRSISTDTDLQAVAPMIHAAGDPVESERRRLNQINGACRGDWADAAERVDELKASAVSGGIDLDELLAELRTIRGDQLRATVPFSRPSQSARRPGADARVVEAAFALAGGLSGVEAQYDEQTLDAADKMRRHVGLQNLIMRAACQNGYRADHAETIHAGNIRPVMQAAFSPIHAQGWSTMSVTGILSNTANKFLVDGWQETSGDEWRKISEVKPLKNFKPATFYRLLENFEYEKVGAAGELKHGTAGEQSLSLKAATYGKMLAITREDIINDDLGAFTDAPRRLGRAAGSKFRKTYWGAFLAADSFFDAGNGNVLTGAGTALTVDGSALEAALVAFRAMRTSVADGRKLIGGKPAVLMVPPALEIVARRLLTSTGIVAGGASTTDTAPNGNPYQNLAELVVVDWLADADLTGYSAAKWYLLRAPMIAPSMLVGFLNGQQAPTVETADADFNTLGIQMRGYHDFGVGRGECLCGLQMEGVAAEEET